MGAYQELGRDDVPGRQPARRAYAAPLRARQAAATKAAIVEAAVSLFTARGWAATGVRDVAQEAGVSVETVYSHFGGKTDLLMAAVDYAVVGDAAEVPLAQRAQVAALVEGAVVDRAFAAARLARQIWERTAPLHAALREGAAAQSELAECLAVHEERRRMSTEHVAELVAGRPVSAEERDGIWAIAAAEVWQLLTEHAGWSPAEYERWAAQMTLHLLGIGPEPGDAVTGPSFRPRRSI